MKKFLIYFLIMLITASPVSAAGVSLNKWVLNVTLHDSGAVEEIIQAEFENSGTSPLEGFSFVVPASKVTIGKDNVLSIPAVGQEVRQQAAPEGMKISIDFNTPIEPGKKWNGRISLTAENWAVKEGMNYSIDIPVKAPKAIVGGNEIEMTLPLEPEIRGQVFLSEGVNAVSIEPSVDAISKKPAYKKLLQFDRVVLTWFQLHIGDMIRVKGSFSDVLKQIVDADKKSRELSARIKTAKEQGSNVSEAETHLKNAEDYNTNQALQSFWKNDNKVALEFIGYANDELKLAESSLSAPKTTGVQETPGKPAPMLGAAGFVLVLLISFLAMKKKRSQ